jgi:hypothetical protein
VRRKIQIIPALKNRPKLLSKAFRRKERGILTANAS